MCRTEVLHIDGLFNRIRSSYQETRFYWQAPIMICMMMSMKFPYASLSDA